MRNALTVIGGKNRMECSYENGHIFINCDTVAYILFEIIYS